MSVSYVCVCVFSVGNGLCIELFTLSEKSYWVFVSTYERSRHVDNKGSSSEVGWRATKIKNLQGAKNDHTKQHCLSVTKFWRPQESRHETYLAAYDGRNI